MLVVATSRFQGEYSLHCRKLAAQRCSSIRGKLGGGSSGINGLAWNRAAAAEYDAWASLAGDGSWGWSELLPFMRKSEKFAEKPTDPFPGISAEAAASADANQRQVDGFSGPIVVRAYTQLCLPYVLKFVCSRLR